MSSIPIISCPLQDSRGSFVGVFLFVELSFTCHLHLYYHQTPKICWTPVTSVSSLCILAVCPSAPLQPSCASFEWSIDSLGTEVLPLLSVPQLQMDEKWMEKNKPHMKAQVFTISGSGRGFVPLSGSFSLALVTPLCHKKNDFTFSMHSAASSSGCLFKDNEASICSLKSSVVCIALWSPDFWIIFSYCCLWNRFFVHFLIPICCL